MTSEEQPLIKPKRWPKIVLIIASFIFVLLLASVLLVRRTYLNNLKPISDNQTLKHVTIESGSTVGEIADLLEQNKLIRSDWAFEWYVRSKELRDSLQAGTYSLKEAQSIPEIVDILSHGKVASDLVTILPGKRLDQVKSGLVKAGFSEQDITAALNPALYQDHPALSDKPLDASLEGYLYPESFQKTANTKLEVIVALALDQMATRLTPDVRAKYAARGLNVHQAVTLASIIEQEVSDPADKAQAAQVFYSRLREGMRLESDPTAKYGAAIAGEEPFLDFDSPYNTYLYGGLPPGPISNVSEASLDAVANPAPTDWLFFVAGTDCITRFSRSNQEHEQLKQRYGVRQTTTECPSGR